MLLKVSVASSGDLAKASYENMVTRGPGVFFTSSDVIASKYIRWNRNKGLVLNNNGFHANRAVVKSLLGCFRVRDGNNRMIVVWLSDNPLHEIKELR